MEVRPKVWGTEQDEQLGCGEEDPGVGSQRIPTGQRKNGFPSRENRCSGTWKRDHAVDSL